MAGLMIKTPKRQLSLEEVIAMDCRYWEGLVNKDRLYKNFMYLNRCRDTDKNGLWQLILNGRELWYGTLGEINAIVKSMCDLADPRIREEIGWFG